MFPSRIVPLAFAAVSLAPLCGAGTLTVGPSGSGAQFTEIQAAVDAALAGDVILVKPGTYREIVVTKPLRILGDGTGVVRISGTGFAAEVRAIAAGEELVLSGVELRATPTTPARPVILLQDCPGTVVLHGLVLPDEDTFTVGVKIGNCARAVLLEGSIVAGSPGGNGAVLAQASEVWIDNSEITGESITDTHLAAGAPGIELVASTLRVWRSRIRGGSLGTVLKLFGSGSGAAGIKAVGSRLDHFGGSGAEITGGMGAFDSLLALGWPGGPGVDLTQTSRARIQANVLVQGGLEGSGAPRAPSIRVDGTSTFTRDPRTFPTLASDRDQVQLGSALALTLAGNPAGFQVLYLSLRTGPTTAIRGVEGFGLLDRASMIQIASQVLPASGVHTLRPRVPTSTALIGATLFFQAAERLGNSIAIGNPVLVTITG